ncbi:MAG: hypothetical protein GY820_28015 [Gammaproteobacteria bacterium]|nr:hypothetical protein [Gammaproteobacteria bacterium]
MHFPICRTWSLLIKNGRISLEFNLQIKIKIPNELKETLVDDWDIVTGHAKLAKLPARMAAEQVFFLSKTQLYPPFPSSNSGVLLEYIV